MDIRPKKEGAEVPASHYNAHAAAPGTPSSPDSLPPQPCARCDGVDGDEREGDSGGTAEKYVTLPHNSHSQRSLGLKPFPDEALRVLDQDRREHHRIPMRLVVWRPCT